MDERPERFSETLTPEATLERFENWYHVPLLAALVAFMFWTRTQAYERFVRPDGTIMFGGVDAWYHWRTTMYTVKNWPTTMPYDPWTHYPHGANAGPFGTLFDQIIATVALIVGVGTPTEGTVGTVFILAPAVMGTLVAIPTYFIGKRLGSRVGGVAAVALLALFPGTFFQRSLVGFTDHHVAEVLFAAIALLAMMVALAVAEREKPVYELLQDRDDAALRGTLGYAALAGVALALYVWTWPPGVLLIGILGVFFAIELVAKYVIGESPEHLAFTGATSLGVAGVLLLASIEVTTISPTHFGPLQPLLAFAVAGGCVFLAWLARTWDARDFDRHLYPITVGALILISVGFVAIALPDLFATIRRNLMRILLFGQTDTTLTIAEAQAVEDVQQHVFEEYGLAFYTAAIGLVALILRPLFGDHHRAENLLIVVWSVFMIAAAFTQIRFNYYLAVAVAVLNAYVVALVLQMADVPSTRARLGDVKAYHVLTVLTVLMVLFVPLLPPIAGTTVIDRGAATGPSGNAVKWEPANAYLANQTPEQGTYGGADNRMDPYDTYAVPGDGDYEYPEGSYGVMSWWDYGHLITVQGERIPHANPFQQGVRPSSAFFTAQSELEADLILEALATGEPVHDRTADELRELADERTEQQRQEQIRYVMIDDEMAGGKFSAIATWTGPGYGAFVSQQEYQVAENESIRVTGVNDRYENATLARLYFDDADGMEGYRLVHETERKTQFESVAIKRGDQPWRPIYVNRELTFRDQIRLSQLEQHPEIEVRTYERREASAVKTYERVEGATIAGTVDAPEGTTVTAQVVMRATTSDRTFVYSQEATVDENGEFELTVPYATDNELGPEEGYTDAAVIAEGDFVVFTGTEEDPEQIGETEVSETDVYDGGTVDVTLESAGEDETVETPEDKNGDGDGDADE